LDTFQVPMHTNFRLALRVNLRLETGMIFWEISQSSMKKAIQMIHQMATTMSSTMLSTKKNKLWNLEDKSPLKLLEHKPLIRPN